jgi:tetratricopeptide (TPR) repeat protein
MGRLDEAVTAARRALELDPVSSHSMHLVGFYLILARKYDEAIDLLLQSIELEPDYYTSYWDLGIAFAGKGLHSEMAEALEKAVSLVSTPGAEALLAWSYGICGQRKKAEQKLFDFMEIRNHKYFPAFFIALTHLGLDNQEETLNWLETAVEERDHGLITIGSWEVFDSLRSRPRFGGLMRRMQLVQ